MSALSLRRTTTGRLSRRVAGGTGRQITALEMENGDNDDDDDHNDDDDVEDRSLPCRSIVER